MSGGDQNVRRGVAYRMDSCSHSSGDLQARKMVEENLSSYCEVKQADGVQESPGRISRTSSVQWCHGELSVDISFWHR
jgi:hypothetical protein